MYLWDEMESHLPSRPASSRSIELFTGAGGLALGAHLAGFQHEALVEWNGDACDTLRANVASSTISGIEDWRIIEGDCRSVVFQDFGGIDLVSGGPPCQPFSIAGKHRGADDLRNMIPEFVRAIRELVPRAFIMENVRGLLRQGFRTYFSYILLELTYPAVVRQKHEGWIDHLRRLEEIHTRGHFTDLRYNVVFRLLNAADYGVPQTRERVFLVGFRDDTGIEWHFPEPSHSLDALLHEQWVSGDYWERHEIPQPKSIPAWLGQRGRRTSRLNLLGLEPWRTVRDAVRDLPDPREHAALAILNHRFISGARSYVGHTGSPLDLPAKTLKAGDHGVPGGENMLACPDGTVRYFTVREAARLQTFPDSWRLEGSWTEAMRQLGNAVPVELSRIIATSVANALRGKNGRLPDLQSP